MSTVLIRPAKKEDCGEIQRLIQELADFEKFPDSPKLTIEELERDGFESTPEKFKCFVAEHPDDPQKLCGFALYLPVYSTWTGKGIRLEDLYVIPEFRGTGLGKRLFTLVAKEAYEGGFWKIDFSVFGGIPAAGFYRNLGAENATDVENRQVWYFYREAMEKLL